MPPDLLDMLLAALLRQLSFHVKRHRDRRFAGPAREVAVESPMLESTT